MVLLNPWIGDLLVVGIVVAVVAAASVTYALIETPGRLFGRRLFAGSGNRLFTARDPEMRVTKPDLRGGCVRSSPVNS